jgi:deoxyribonuclease-4
MQPGGRPPIDARRAGRRRATRVRGDARERAMLIGAHVSPAGGPANAIARGVEKGCRAIQIFNQNPRAWRPTVYSDEQIAAYHEARRSSRIDALLIHAVYLLNAASEDKEIRDKTRASLIASLQAGDALGAHAVVLHAGSAKTGSVGPAVKRAGKVIAEALAESDHCALHLENTAGAGGTLGRSFHELAELIDAAGRDDRLGICLDSCHLLASGFEIRTPEALGEVLDECVGLVGIDRVGSLHLNDSQTPLGSNRDRHANVGEGELGDDGCAVFLSEPRFDGLPCVLETPGADRTGPSPAEIAHVKSLRKRGLARRRRATGAAPERERSAASS